METLFSNSLEQALQRLRATAGSGDSNKNKEKGTLFEYLVVRYLRFDDAYRGRDDPFDPDMIWVWGDSAAASLRQHLGKTSQDTGIDVLAVTVGGRNVAIQCKFYDSGKIAKDDINSFVAETGVLQGMGLIHERILIHVSPGITAHAMDLLKKSGIEMVDRARLEQSGLDWIKLLEHKAPFTKKQPFAHQIAAIDDVVDRFVRPPHGTTVGHPRTRGQLIMACGTGKTYTALKIAEQLLLPSLDGVACGGGNGHDDLGHNVSEQSVGEDRSVLFLVPSISLLSQSFRAWLADHDRDRFVLRPFLVCSDQSAGDTEDMDLSELGFPVTTLPERLADSFAQPVVSGRAGGALPILRVVFSTYQSVVRCVSVAQHRHGLPSFDLLIADEAHRTTGVALQGEDPAAFQAVHDDALLRAHRRLYMTATPRFASGNFKDVAAQRNHQVFAMDDETLYGEEFHRLEFGDAVEQGLLTDYQVVVLNVDRRLITGKMATILTSINRGIEEEEHASATGKKKKEIITVDTLDAARIVGCYRALYDQGHAVENTDPLQRVVVYTQSIVLSKLFTQAFPRIAAEYRRVVPTMHDAVAYDVKHVDGTTASSARDDMLSWLRAPMATSGHDADDADDTSSTHNNNNGKILSNVRCLTEGVDVPALDGIVFLHPRRSQIDIIQAVGRVMRNAPGKKMATIVIPVVVPPGAGVNEAREADPNFDTIWNVLEALKAHDARIDVELNQMMLHATRRTIAKLTSINPKGEITDPDDQLIRIEDGREQTIRMQEWALLVNAELQHDLGDRMHWQSWSKQIAGVVQNLEQRIRAAATKADDPDLQRSFNTLLDSMQQHINANLGVDDAIDVLAQNAVTGPIFDAMVGNDRFTALNPVAHALDRFRALIETRIDDADRRKLAGFFRSIERYAERLETAESKAMAVHHLYGNFFETAFPRLAQKLGIVYTPTPIIDFMLHSVDELSRRHFGKGLTDEKVAILDPFTGTGAFVHRLIANRELIADADIERKFRHELFACETVVFAYYMACLMIELVYQERTGNHHTEFPGAVWTDTFNLGQFGAAPALFEDDPMRANTKRAAALGKMVDDGGITVIIGNPPYSSGQRNANDANPNDKHAAIEQRVTNTYAAAAGKVALKKSLYDSYIKAFRWASDAIKGDGIVAFVTNNGFLDGLAARGLRRCLADEFAEVYLIDLRGNARYSGERARREGEVLFGTGTRAGIVITLLVKRAAKPADSPATIHYHDIGDYLSRDDKFNRITAAREASALDFTIITPDTAGDWFNHRDIGFDALIPLGDPNAKGKSTASIFPWFSQGINTSRDPWVYGFDATALVARMRGFVDFYHVAMDDYHADHAGEPPRDIVAYDASRIKWGDTLLQSLKRGIRVKGDLAAQVVDCAYRPFVRKKLLYNKVFFARQYRVPRFFPTGREANRVIVHTGMGGKHDFAALMCDCVPDLNLINASQGFARYWYDPDGRRHDNISSIALDAIRGQSGINTLTADDVFDYVYGVLHAPDFRARFANNLRKERVRIPIVRGDAFVHFAEAGAQLGTLHTGYDAVAPYPDLNIPAAAGPLGNLVVGKMGYGKRLCPDTGKKIKDKSSVIVTPGCVITAIPERAHSYVINGKSALDWVIEGYSKKTDKESGITHDPNAAFDTSSAMRGGEYIVALIGRIISVSLQTTAIVESLPPTN